MKKSSKTLEDAKPKCPVCGGELEPCGTFQLRCKACGQVVPDSSGD